MTLENDYTLYTVGLDIGTPPQHFQLQIDTGSSDLFVPSIDEDFCQLDLQDCIRTGAYTANQSSTSISLEAPFTTSFRDQSAYNGTFYEDTVQFSSVTLKNVQFGVVEQATVVSSGGQGLDAIGLLGVGFESNEATNYYTGSDRFTYPNIISELYNNGLIGARASSLYINGRDVPTGSILFGGTDNSLYNGPLISVPMVAGSEASGFRDYAIKWTSFTATSPSGTINLFTSDSNDVPIYTIIDCGSTGSLIPPSLIPSLYAYLGAIPFPDNPYVGIVPCNLSTASADLSFGFGGPDGPKITTPLSDYIIPHSDNPELAFADGTQVAG